MGLLFFIFSFFFFWVVNNISIFVLNEFLLGLICIVFPTFFIFIFNFDCLKYCINLPTVILYKFIFHLFLLFFLYFNMIVISCMDCLLV